MSSVEKKNLRQNIIAGLPGSEEHFSIEQFQQALDKYSEIHHNQLRENLVYFLSLVIPVAEVCGIILALHPDDPLFQSWDYPVLCLIKKII
jgi:mannonate dehydratase